MRAVDRLSDLGVDPSSTTCCETHAGFLTAPSFGVSSAEWGWEFCLHWVVQGSMCWRMWSPSSVPSTGWAAAVCPVLFVSSGNTAGNKTRSLPSGSWHSSGSHWPFQICKPTALTDVVRWVLHHLACLTKSFRIQNHNMKCGEVNTVAFCTMKQEYVRKWSAGFQILYVFCEITSVCLS